MKPVKGLNPPISEHDQVAFDARGNRDLFKAGGFGFFRFQLSAFQQTDCKAFTTMRGNKIGHVFVLLSIM
jgi:hypothetical protein